MTNWSHINQAGAERDLAATTPDCPARTARLPSGRVSITPKSVCRTPHPPDRAKQTPFCNPGEPGIGITARVADAWTKRGELPDAERRLLNLPGDSEADLVQDLLSVCGVTWPCQQPSPPPRGERARRRCRGAEGALGGC